MRSIEDALHDRQNNRADLIKLRNDTSAKHSVALQVCQMANV